MQQETLGHRGRAGDPPYGIRRVLPRAHHHHSDLSWTRLLRGLDLGDPRGEVAAAWIAAQELRLLYRLRDPRRAAQAFSRWLAFCADFVDDLGGPVRAAVGEVGQDVVAAPVQGPPEGGQSRAASQPAMAAAERPE